VNTAAGLTLAEFEAGRLPEVIAMWRHSFEAGVGITDPHPLAEQEQYFLNEVLPHHQVRLALRAQQVVGFVAASPESISQLYVRVESWHQGIGPLLLAWAKAESGGSLWLYTFARNARACAFYERHGFVAVARGFEPTWKLEDVKYQWVASGQNATHQLAHQT
jgi:ribosomal protein S18 acetylase RimI-like enzyme